MFKNGIILFLIAIITLTAVFFAKGTDNSECEYLRIHVRANSNETVDQNVKYLIKDDIVEFLTPIVAKCESKEEAISSLKEAKTQIEGVANKVLSERGFDYKAKVSVKNEYFPTRVYDGLTLEEGYYDCLIVELGKAEGDNWWCVVYPPLCFVNCENISYRSKIAEIIRRFNNDRR